MSKILTKELMNSEDVAIRQVLESANPMVLLGVVYHATGDEELLSIRPERVLGVFSDVWAVTDPDDLSLIRRKAFELLRAYRDGRQLPPADSSASRILAAMRLASGEALPEDEYRLHADILGLESHPRGWGKPPEQNNLPDLSVIVIGAGFQGINAAVQLKAAGISFTLLEKSGGPGGTWWQTKYPGARVDAPSRFYSHSYAGTEYPFEHHFAPSDETERYINWVIDRYSIRPHLRFGTRVTGLNWSDDEQQWHVKARDEAGEILELTANVVISAIGLLERINVPNLPGMSDYTGQVIHAGRFRSNDVHLENRKVVVVGSGCSGAQLVPDVARVAGDLTVFQRTPGWIIPVEGYRSPMPEAERWLNANVPYYANWLRFSFGMAMGDYAIGKMLDIDPEWKEPDSPNQMNFNFRNKLAAYMEEKLAERPDLMDLCRPDHPPYGSRPIVDNGWFDALKQDNVTVRREGIVAFAPEGVVAANGDVVPADVVILATGYQTRDYFSEIEITGRDGVSMASVWEKDGPRAYWGMTIPHMPNLFVLYGPNANPRNLGPVQYGEWQTDYILQCLKLMTEEGLSSVEVKSDVFWSYNERLDERLGSLIALHYRKSGYMTAGRERSAIQMPWYSAEVKKGIETMNPSDFEWKKSDR